MLKRNPIINQDISQEKLLKFLGLPDSTKVYCCDKYNIPKDIGDGEIFVLRYKLNFNNTYSIRVYEKQVNAWCSVQTHNPFGPALIIFHNNNEIHISYHIRSQMHRPFLPAFKVYNTDGTLIREYYYLQGKAHNRSGPAYRSFYEDGVGEIWHNYFYINNEEITLDEFCKMYEERS